jgi:hypothetical protein
VSLQVLMIFSLPVALQWITLAQGEIARALLVINQPVSTSATSERTKRMAVLNRHFALDTLSGKARALEQMQLVYQAMADAVNQAGRGAFRVYDGTRVPGVDAFTFMAGFDEPDSAIDPGTGVRKRAIYIPVSIVGPLCKTQARGVGTIVHELAHFVGSPKNIGYIDDQAYGGPKAPALVTMGAYYRLRNAENYANFCYELGSGDSAGWYIQAG